MKTQLRLGSIVADGIGGPECGAIDLIYMYLLQEFGQDFYKRVSINQIGDDADEFVIMESNNGIHVNIKCSDLGDFSNKSTDEKNKIRLRVIHDALLKIAKFDNKLNISKLEAIKNKILLHDFSFEFDYKIFKNKIKNDLVCKIVVKPLINKFILFAEVEKNGKIICKTTIFEGLTTMFYLDSFFCFAKWKGENEVIIYGKQKTVRTHLLIESCTLDIVNLTGFENPPYYTLMKYKISNELRDKAQKDWRDSLPPNIEKIIRYAND